MTDAAKGLWRSFALAWGVGLAISLVMLLVIWGNQALAASADTAETRASLRHNALRSLDDVQRGSLVLKLASGGTLVDAPQLETDVEIRISGMVTRAVVRQRFRNPAADWVEGTYVFPLPDDAAVDHMRLKVGERVIEGEIREKQAAQKIYEKARAEGKRAALLRQERPNMFTTKVANIAPGAEVTVEIAYQQTLSYRDGGFSLRFPMVVGPRYIPGEAQTADIPVNDIRGFDPHGWSMPTDQVPDAHRVTPPVIDPADGSINPVRIRVQLDAGMALAQIDSPYHPVTVQQQDGGSYRVELREGPVPADRDFLLTWRPKAEHAPRAAFFREQRPEGEYGLLMLLPPERQSGQPPTRAMPPRELILVVDSSGSMSGESIEQAKRALVYALGRLRDIDSFNIMEFDNDVARLFSRAMPVTERNTRRALEFIDDLQADGGTEIVGAMREALDGQEHPGRLRQVVFITDGAVGNERALFATIAKGLGDSRLFLVGIGSAPNSYLMTRAADHGRGSFTFIGKLGEVEEKMAALFGQLEAPALRDLAIEWGGDSASGRVEQWPQRTPDLYLGEPLLLSLRAARLPDSVRISGTIGNQRWQQELPLSGGGEDTGLHVLWARRQIRDLMASELLGGDAAEIKGQITQLGLTHHLVTRHTSLVAVDKTPVRPASADLKSGPVPTNLPKGWKAEGVFGQLPQTATPAGLHLLIGTLLLLAGVLLAGPQWWRDRAEQRKCRA